MAREHNLRSPETSAKIAAAWAAKKAAGWKFPARPMTVSARDKMAESHRASGSPKAPLLEDDDVRSIRLLIAAGWKLIEIARLFEVSPEIVSFIKSGKTYSRVK